MFGYIKPFKPELKICEFEAYKAVYCGLCGELGRSFGPPARLTLSYDFTFVSMLYFSLSDEQSTISRRRCYVNPLKKTPCAGSSEALRFGADIAAIMLYHKLCDNIADSALIKKAGWYLLKPFAAGARKKAAKLRPEADGIVVEYMQEQALIETGKCASLDEAAEPTAKAMSRLFCLISQDEKVGRVLERLGYFLGRYVYICDALDDIESDLKNGGYNPLILRFGIKKEDKNQLKSAKDSARDSLYMTIGEAARAYDLLELNAFKPVLNNIIALGLQSSVKEIYEGSHKRRKRQD